MSSHVQQQPIPPGLLSLLVTKYEAKSQKHVIQNLYKLQVESYKNESGKYECPTCKKSYVHFKHLRRHNRQHTGYRPHVCHICRDTFCRSDILKRHYERCFSKFIATGKLSAKSRVPKISRECIEASDSHPTDSHPRNPIQPSPTPNIPITAPNVFNTGTLITVPMPSGTNPKYFDYYQTSCPPPQPPPKKGREDIPLSYSDTSIPTINIGQNNIPSPSSLRAGPTHVSNIMDSYVKQEEVLSPTLDTSSSTPGDSNTPIVSPVSLTDGMSCISENGMIDMCNNTQPSCDDYLQRIPFNRKFVPAPIYYEDIYTYKPDPPPPPPVLTMVTAVPRIISVVPSSNDIVFRWLESDW